MPNRLIINLASPPAPAVNRLQFIVSHTAVLTASYMGSGANRLILCPPPKKHIYLRAKNVLRRKDGRVILNPCCNPVGGCDVVQRHLTDDRSLLK